MSIAADTATSPARRGLGEAFASNGASKSRFPFLEDVFEQAARRHADELRRLQPSAFFSSAGIEGGSLGDAVEGAEGSAIAAVFRVDEWSSHIVIKLTRQFLLTMVEMLFGGDGAEPAKTDERPFSAIESRLAKSVALQFAKALEDAFGTTGRSPEFRLERIESRLEFALAGRREDAAVSGKFRLKALGRGGLVFVIMPQAPLNLLLGREQRTGAAQDGRGDGEWSRLIGAELRRSEVRLAAVLDERRVTLGEVASWKVGQTIGLKAGPASQVRLACNDAAILSCELGQADGVYTLRVAESIEEQEFLHAILSR